MSVDDVTYSFKEVFDERFKRLGEDISEIKSDVRGLRDGHQASAKEIEHIKGKMLVYGSLSIVVGTAIASLVVKLVGS